MSFLTTVAYDDSDVIVYVDNVKVGLVRSITEYVKTEMLPLKAFGETQPVSVSPGGKSYEVVLTRQESQDGLSFSLFDDFTLRLKRARSVVVYTRCRVKSDEIVRTAGEPMLEKITLTAEGRKEV